MTTDEFNHLDIGDIVYSVNKEIPMMVMQKQPQIILARTCLLERLCDWELLSKAHHPIEDEKE